MKTIKESINSKEFKKLMIYTRGREDLRIRSGESMNRIKILNFLVLTTIFSLFPSCLSSAEKVQDISTKTAVIFNTLCAKCHEGECNGRLSLDSDSQVEAVISKTMQRRKTSLKVKQKKISSFGLK